MPIKDWHEEEMLQLWALPLLWCEPGTNLYIFKENPLTWGEPVIIQYNERENRPLVTNEPIEFEK